MAVQWLLVASTALIAWSAGIAACQAALDLAGRGARTCVASSVLALVLTLAGITCQLARVGHIERVFNMFGNIASQTTQALLCTIVLAALLAAAIVALRRGDEGAAPPAWLSAAVIVAATAAVTLMACSQMLPGRPARNTWLWVACVLSGAAVLGPATLAALMAWRDAKAPRGLETALVGTAVLNVVALAGYAAHFFDVSAAGEGGGSPFYDGTSPQVLATGATGVTSTEMLVVTVGMLAVGAVLPAVLAILGRTRRSWKTLGWLVTGCALVGAVALRVVFFSAGLNSLSLTRF